MSFHDIVTARASLVGLSQINHGDPIHVTVKDSDFESACVMEGLSC
jgi:hypothetical protein